MIIVTRMTAVTSRPACLSVLDGLLDWERSKRFHSGAVVLDPARFEVLLTALPPLEWPRVAVHVAGSEGKTSATETLAAGLTALGLPTGAYTSPHLVDVRERFRIDGLGQRQVQQHRQITRQRVHLCVQAAEQFQWLHRTDRPSEPVAGADPLTIGRQVGHVIGHMVGQVGLPYQVISLA